MKYLSLNRRWRPRSFDDVTRQEHVTRTLRNAVSGGRVAQAYLFGGRRGTGKTTMARILAMCLNCRKDEGPSPEPCGVCDSCASIVAGSSPDVIELDAASNRGIDEIRTLQENVRLAPMSGRYKIYIIDEAHQMTKDAYNAFLKTLEEPPPHVVFVLATTEPEKILATVRSRCQRFDFRPVPEKDIVERLTVVAQAEKIEAAPELLEAISRKAEGSLRDALGLLEQCVAFAGENPSVSDFLTVTGGVERDSLERLSGLIRDRRVSDALSDLEAMIQAGRDPGAVCSGLVSYLREVFLSLLRREEELSGAPWTSDELVAFMDVLARAEAEMRYSPQPRLVLEMALLHLGLRPPAGAGMGSAEVAPPPSAPSSSQPSAPSSSQPSAPSSSQPSSPSPPATSPIPAFKVEPEDPGLSGRAVSPEKAGPSHGHPDQTGHTLTDKGTGARSGDGANVGLSWFVENWDALLDRVRKKSVFTRAFLLRARPASLNDGVLTLGFEVQFHKEHMEDEKNRRVLEQAIAEATGRRLRVRCSLFTGSAIAGDTAAASPGGGGPIADAGAISTAGGPSADTAADRGPGPSRGESGAAPSAEASPAPKSGDPRPENRPAEPLHSALAIFGGRVIDDEKPGGRP